MLRRLLVIQRTYRPVDKNSKKARITVNTGFIVSMRKFLVCLCNDITNRQFEWQLSGLSSTGGLWSL